MKKIISTKNAPTAIGPYSQAVEIDNMLFVSGQIPINPNTGEIVEGGIKEQTYQVLKNIEAIITSANYKLEDIVKCTCILSDLNNFSEMNDVYTQFFKENPPARVTFEASKLPKNVLVEIDAIAIKTFK